MRFLFLVLPFFVFCVIFFGSIQSAYAVTDRCPRHEIVTSMKSKLYKTHVFRGTSHGFTEYTQGHSGDGGGRTLGFVEYKVLTTDVDMDFDVVDIGNNQYCVKMTKVRGVFNMHPKLFMPTDYRKSSCEYQQVLKHEKRHLNKLKEFHGVYSKKFEAHLGRVARSVPVPNPVSSREEIDVVVGQLRDYFLNDFKEFELKSWEILLAEQAKIDSPQEYIGVSKRCTDW